jgi:SP family xylose:H+ symportor-like MFS transporter
MHANPATTPPQTSSGRGTVIYGAVVAALGGLLFGFDTAVISGAEGQLKELYHLDAFSHGFTVAIALIGTIIGSFSVGKPADRFGRRKVLFTLAILYFVSALGCALANSWLLFLISRLIGGLAIGAASVVAPMYIAEISPGHLRGRLVAVNQLNVVLGILLSFISNYLIAQWVSDQTAWRWMLGIVAVPSAIFFFLIFGIPESPRWLVRAGRLEEARAVLKRLGEADPDRELGDIQRSLTIQPGGAQEALFQRRYARSVLLAFAIAMFNQLSGINALMYYAPRIFSMAGAEAGSALLQSIAVGGTNLLFTVLALFVIDRFGRRVLMLAGSVGYVLSLGTTAWAFYHYSSSFTSTGSRIVLASLLLFIASHAFGQGAVIWVFISEIFPNSVRAKGQAFGSFTHWFMAAAVSWTFPIIAQASGGTAFAFFAVMMFLQLLWVVKVMPETRGGTLEQIEQRLAKPSATTASLNVPTPVSGAKSL